MGTFEIEVGQEVGVAQTGAWKTRSQGIYKVVKKDKVKIVVQRLSDGYERKFSAKDFCEFGATSKYTAAHLESVADQLERNKEQSNKAALENAWGSLESAARAKDLAKVNGAIGILKALIDKA